MRDIIKQGFLKCTDMECLTRKNDISQVWVSNAAVFAVFTAQGLLCKGVLLTAVFFQLSSGPLCSEIPCQYSTRRKTSQFNKGGAWQRILCVVLSLQHTLSESALAPRATCKACPENEQGPLWAAFLS